MRNTKPACSARLIGLLGVACLLALAVWAYFASGQTIETSVRTVEHHTGGAGPVVQGNTVAQRFTAPEDSLGAVSVMTSTARKALGSGALTLSLYDSQGGLVAVRQLESQEIGDNRMAVLEFPPQKGSKGKAYTLKASAQGFTDGNAPYLRMGAPKDGSGVLSLELNGMPQEGKALYMEITCLHRQYGWELAFVFILLCVIALGVCPLLPGKRGKKAA